MNTEFKRMQYLAGLITEGQLNEQESFDIEQARELVKQGKKNFPLSKKLGITKFPIEIKDTNGNEIYYEKSEGLWIKKEYDSNNKEIYYEDSKGFWIKRKWNSKGNEIYLEDSKGFWIKTEYDSKGKRIYYENSKGVIKNLRRNKNKY